MNILAIGAHPDDIEISCGGTLAKYAKLGHKVFTATATNGNIGSATLSMEEIAKYRDLHCCVKFAEGFRTANGISHYSIQSSYLRGAYEDGR